MLESAKFDGGGHPNRRIPSSRLMFVDDDVIRKWSTDERRRWFAKIGFPSAAKRWRGRSNRPSPPASRVPIGAKWRHYDAATNESADSPGPLPPRVHVPLPVMSNANKIQLRDPSACPDKVRGARQQGGVGRGGQRNRSVPSRLDW